MNPLYISERLYQIPLGRAFFVRDVPNSERDRLLFHVNSGDYFAVIATLLGFLQENIGSREILNDMDQEQVTAIRTMRSDLRYLHDNYKIVPKESSEKQVSAF